MKFFKKIFCFPFTKTHSKNEKLIIYDEANNSYNLKNKDDRYLYAKSVINGSYGLCPECNQPNTWYSWCKKCYAIKFQQNFGNWTSENDRIDKLSQLNAKSPFELLEWIPYDQLRNTKFLAQGGFSTIYEAIWLDGCIYKWNYEKQEWERLVDKLNEQDYEDAESLEIKNPLKINEQYGYDVVLKSLNDSSNISGDFLNEWKLHLQCQHKARSNYSGLVPLIGITQDPETLDYMIVMYKIPFGSLRNNLRGKKYNPNDKFTNLLLISAQLEAIHELNLIHGDFHDGNLLYSGVKTISISDLGLCRLVNQPITNDIYVVIPYIVPEVLRGKPYTKAADIYSFGMIMWEMTSGVPAFHNISHDFQLSLEICEGTRPQIIEGTMPEYVKLMKRCWDNDPKKRPTANELKRMFEKWFIEYPIEMDIKRRVKIPENEPKIIYHPKSYYISRKINHSIKLNEILEQDDEISNKIIIEDNDSDIKTSGSLENCIIIDN